METPIKKQLRWNDEDIERKLNNLKQDIDNTFEGTDEVWITKKKVNELIDKSTTKEIK